MKIMKKVLCGLIATAMCVGTLVVTGLDAKAAEEVKIDIEYLYINESGDNVFVNKIVSVPEGTTWGEFFEEGSYLPEAVVSDAIAGAKWTPTIQRIIDSYDMQKDKVITRFNQYTDTALLEFYGYTGDYKEVAFGFETIFEGECVDSGTGGTLILPTKYEFGSEEAIKYFENNYKVIDYLEKVSKLGDVTIYPETWENQTIDYYVVHVDLYEKKSAWDDVQEEDSQETDNKEEAPIQFGFAKGEDEKSYWYEEGVKQGTYDDPKCIYAMGALRGREIYDPVSDGWYWLDVVFDGAKACNKEVWMPYIYQDEAAWDDAEIEANANDSGSMKQQVIDFIKNGYGKWVRYDADGKMVKGWYTVEGADAEIYPDQVGNTYYYDFKTGLMAKGWQTIKGEDYYFNEVTGVLQQ